MKKCLDLSEKKVHYLRIYVSVQKKLLRICLQIDQTPGVQKLEL